MARHRKAQQGQAQPATWDPSDPKVWHRFLSSDVTEPTAQQIAYVKGKLEREATEIALHRKIMEFLGAPSCCLLKACRRSGRCSGPGVVCYDAALPWLQEHFFPDFNRLVRERWEAGYYAGRDSEGDMPSEGDPS